MNAIQPKILICTAHDIRADARPRRMIHFLADMAEITCFSSGVDDQLPAQGIALGKPGIWQRLMLKAGKLLSVCGYDHLLNYSRGAFTFGDHLQRYSYNLVILYDLFYLPYVISKLPAGTRLWVDAREYYPEHFNDLWWRILEGGWMRRTTANYLNKADRVLTVSRGLGDLFQKNFGIKTTLLESCEDHYDIVPGKVDPNSIKIVHHGSASPARQLERMIFMMDHLDNRYHLDMILLGDGTKYHNYLNSLANTRRNVSILPGIPYSSLVRKTSQYDIGIFLAPITTTNLRITLPNKLFQFIQSRLAVLIGPNQEMARIVKEWSNGVVCKDFEPETFATAISTITPEEVFAMKQASHRAAERLNTREQKNFVQLVARQELELQ